MAVEKIYMVGYASIGNSENTSIHDHYIVGHGMTPGMTTPKVWNYRVTATNADEARYFAWKLFLKDFYKDTPLGRVDSSKWLKLDDSTTNFRVVYCYVDTKASSGTVGKNEEGVSRNVELNANGKRRRIRKNKYRKNSTKSTRTINGKTPNTDCVTKPLVPEETTEDSSTE